MIVLTENEYRDDDFTITKNGRNFILKEYKGNDKIVIVPNYVTVIGENAFYKNKDIVKVIIKEGVTKIENCAFYCCNKLEYIEIPTTLKVIEGAVFYFCKNLKEIKLNDGLTEIGFASFQGCLKLTKLELPDTLVYIGEDAFLNCSDLKFNVYDNAKYLGGKTNPYLYLFKVVRTNIKSCKIHNDTKFIGSESFKFCSNLDEIIIPNGVKRIGNSAFCYCTKIERINIPDSVVFIGNSAFSNCDNLLSVNLPSNLNNINDSLFCNSGKLETVVIPDNVKTIERLAFSYCENLKSIKLSKNLEILNYWVFSNCKKLDYVEIPKDIKTIDNYAFEDCEQLNITYYGNMYFHSFEKSLNSIYAPNIPLNSISPNQKEKYIEGFFKNYNDIKNMDAENFKRYLKYIKTNRIKYYDAFNENVCKFMVENKIIKLEEVDALIKKTTYSNHIELSAMLLDYKNKNFSSEEIEKQIEKDLFEEKIISFSNLKSLWI